MRKTFLFLILGGLLLVAAGCGGGKSSSGSSSAQSVEVSAPLNSVIRSYFNTYFDSQKTLSYSTMDENILESNANTQMNEALRETLIVLKTQFKTGLQNYKYQIAYQNSTVSGDTATVTLKLDLDFQYINASSKSGIYGVKYTFTLKNNGAAWLVTAIDSDLEEFKTIKAQVVATMSQSSITQSEAVAKVKERLKSNLVMQSQSSLYTKGVSSGISTASSMINNSNTTITQSIYVSCNKYTYNVSSAVAYAKDYALDKSGKFFIYYSNNDCTNFVSQCLWAGYIGYTSGSNLTSKVTAGTGMLNPEWYATSSGAADNWANVDYLWSYITKSKIAGPIATGYNNYTGSNSGLVTGVVASDIKVGDILQFRQGTTTPNDYTHSVFVYEKDANATSYSQIRICSHSSHRFNYSLLEVINAEGGLTDCYMRRISPSTSVTYLK